MSLSPAQCGIVLFRDIMAPMLDGVRLTTDVYHPAENGGILPGPLPALLYRFPQLDLNPNTGEPMDLHTYTRSAHSTVYTDPGRPSHIVLPTIAT